MATKSKLYLKFENERYQRHIDMITEHAQIYIEASKELLRLDVKGYNAENLINGGFLTVFTEYHQNEHLKIKDPIFKKVSFEKYLDLREFDTTKLEELEKKHVVANNYTISLYDYNDSFFSYAKAQSEGVRAQKIYADAMKYAPKIHKYNLFDVLSFKGNRAIIDLPKKHFEIYALNTGQFDLAHQIVDYVGICRRIGFEYKEVKNMISSYITGLDNELKNVQLNFNYILTQKL